MRPNRMQQHFWLDIEKQSQLRVLYVHFSTEGLSPLSVWFSFLAYLCLHSVTAQSIDIPSLVPPLLPIWALQNIELISGVAIVRRNATYIRKSLPHKVSTYKCLDLSLHLCEPFLGLSLIFVLCYNLVNWRIAFHLIALRYPSSLLAVNFLTRRGVTDWSAKLKANWYR